MLCILSLQTFDWLKKVLENPLLVSLKEFIYLVPELKPMRGGPSSTACLDILPLQVVDWELLHGVFAVNVSTMLPGMGRLSSPCILYHFPILKLYVIRVLGATNWPSSVECAPW